VRYLKTQLREFADDAGRFLVVNGIIKGTNDRLFSGVLIPYRALPEPCADKIVVVAFAFAEKKPIALDHVEFSIGAR
jgi:hypothetical protein